MKNGLQDTLKSPSIKFALEVIPLLLFFASNVWLGIFIATGIFVGTTALSLVISWVMTRKIPLAPLISGVFVIVFGGLTIYLHDETFIKVKLTLISLLFAALLFYGVMSGKPLLRHVLGEAIALPEAIWHRLARRWALFFLFEAVLNEALWRSLTTDQWMIFKVFGALPLTVVFALSQVPLMLRHQIPDDPEPPSDRDSTPSL